MEIKLHQGSKKYFYAFLFVLPFLLYWNAIDNEYSMDDNIVVEGIEKVQGGLSNIPEIFTSHYSTDKTQSYGYRPIVSTTFALEKEFFGKLPPKQTIVEKKANNKITQANISHVLNVLLYASTGILLFYFLGKIFPNKNSLLPFIIVVIFIILPIHTEPVNNIKSRDVLLMFATTLCALILYVKYALKGNIKYVLSAMFFVLLAFYSKRSGLALIGLVPVILFFINAKRKRAFIAFLSVLVVLATAILLTKTLLPFPSVRNFEYFENPLFVEGSFLDRIAMGFYTAFFYLKMLIFPAEFSFYYGYAKIQLVDWSFYQVWLGVIIFIPLGFYGILRFLKRDPIGLGILWWLGTMFGVANVIFPMVGVVAERFAYLFSFGFCIVMGVLLVRAFKLETRPEYKYIRIPKAFLITMGIVCLFYSTKIITRNSNWENYLTLFRSDIDHLTKSVKANTMLADYLFKKASLPPTAQNQKNLSQKQQMIKEAAVHYEKVLEIMPNHISTLNNLAVIYIVYLKDYEAAIRLLKKGEKSNREKVAFNLGYAYYQSGQFQKAVPYLIESIEIFPEKRIAYQSLFDIAKNENFRPKVEKELEKIASELENSSFEFNINMGDYYYNKGNPQKAKHYFEKAMKLAPSKQKLNDYIEKLGLNSGEKPLS